MQNIDQVCLFMCAVEIRQAVDNYMEKGEGLMQYSKDAERRLEEKKQAAVDAIREAEDAAVAAANADLRSKAHHRGADAVIARANDMRDRYTVEVIRMPAVLKDNFKKHQAAALALPFLQRGMVATGGCLQPDPWPYSAWEVPITREVRPCISGRIACQCPHPTANAHHVPEGSAYAGAG